MVGQIRVSCAPLSDPVISRLQKLLRSRPREHWLFLYEVRCLRPLDLVSSCPGANRNLSSPRFYVLLDWDE